MLQRVKINSPTEPERRNGMPIEVRTEPDAAVARLSGYTAKFGQRIEMETWFGDVFFEEIAPGAFDRTLRENKDVRALRNHDPNLVLARGKNGTLRLSADSVGLAFDLDLNLKTSVGRDTQADIERGDIDGCSFGFYVREEKIAELPDRTILRTLLDIELVEITPACTFPAYDSTEVSSRSRDRDSRPLPSPSAEFAYRQRCLEIGAIRR